MIIGKADDKSQAGQATIKREHALTASEGLQYNCYIVMMLTKEEVKAKQGSV